MAVYIDTEQVAGIAGIPSLTLEQYNALEVKPKLWFLLNPPEGYKRLSADEVSYDNTTSGLSATNTQGAIDSSVGYMAGDSVEFTLDQFTVFNARLGFSRGRALVSFQLPKKINANTVTVSATVPSSCNVYAFDETRACTITSVSTLNVTENVVTLMINITASTAWTSPYDIGAMVSFNGNVKFNFS